MSLRRPYRRSRSVGLMALAFGASLSAASCHDIDTTRVAQQKATLGDDIYGVFCDRLGASVLPEDLSGASFRSICHFDEGGQYGSTVDTSALPPPQTAEQKESRRLSVAKLERLASRRSELIRAVNAMLPDTDIPDPTDASGNKTIRLHDALFDLTQKLVPLYESNPYDTSGPPLFPSSTDAIGALMASMAQSDAKDALSHIFGRKGMRPFPVGLGATRAALSYKGLRALTRSSLDVLAPGGKTAPELSQLLGVVRQELLTTKIPGPMDVASPVEVDTSLDAASRPRSTSEFITAALLRQHDDFGLNQKERYIALRDYRGFPIIGSPGSLPSAFSDLDGDGYADIDAFGRFIDTGGTALPIESPFYIPGTSQGTPDGFGRLTDTPYGYLDTSRTAIAAVLRHAKPLAQPLDGYEGLMDALAGAYVLYGPREAATYDYATEVAQGEPVPEGVETVSYQRFRADDSPLPDLIHAAGQLLADKDSDLFLLSLIDLFENHADTMARLLDAALRIRDISNAKYQALGLPYEVPIWDEMAELVAEISRRPGLLTALMQALASDAIISTQGMNGQSKHMGDTIAAFLENRDELNYNPYLIGGDALNITTNTLDDPKTPVDQSKPKTGTNRSCLQRSMLIIHDANGGPACNKEGALVESVIPIFGGIDLTWPITGFPVFADPYPQCGLFEIPHLAKFYLGTLLPIDHPQRSVLELKDNALNDILAFAGGLGIASEDDVLIASSGGDLPYGFGLTKKPSPAAVNRLMFFGADSDMYPIMADHDSINENSQINLFISHLIEPVSASSCPKVGAHNVPTCPTSAGTLRIRDRNTIFLWERLGFYNYLQPMVLAFFNDATQTNDACNPTTVPRYSDCSGPKLFVELMEVLNRHWPGKEHGAECSKSGSSKTNKDYCSEAGINTYEKLLAEAFRTDVVPALNAFAKVVTTSTVTIKRGPNKGQVLTGAQALEKMTRALFDPVYAKGVNMVDRKGQAFTTWTDGTPQSQVTIFSLVADALHKMDKRFDDACSCEGKAGPDLDACNQNLNACLADVAARRAQWKSARSRLVDEFLAIDGSGATAKFKHADLPRTAIGMLQAVREQLNAPGRCDKRETGAVCTWAKKDLGDKLATTMSGPLFASLMDLQEKLRADPTARKELETFLQYALDESDDMPLQALLSSIADILQVLVDDRNLGPILRALAPAAAPEGTARTPGVGVTGLKVLNAMNSDDYDRYHVLDHVLPAMVTPMDNGTNLAPIEIILDVIADVHRIDASAIADPLKGVDYGNMMGTMRDFMIDDTRGMEQFYTIIQKRPRP